MIQHTNMRKAVMNFIEKVPFMAIKALRMKYVPDRTVRSITCDGKTIHYSPSFVIDRENKPILEYIIGQLIIACTLSHHTRRGYRDQNTWQKASRIVSFLVLDNIIRTTKKKVDNPICMSMEFRNQSIETVFKKLQDSEAEQQENPDEECDEGVEGPGDGDGEKEGENQTDEGEEEEAEDKEEEEDEKKEDEKKANDPKEYHKFAGEIEDFKGKNSQKPTRQEIQQEQQSMQEEAQQINNMIDEASDMPGMSDEIKEYLKELLTFDVPVSTDWKSVLHRLLKKHEYERNYTWSTPNQRFISSGLYLPSNKTPTRKKIENFVIAIDTSGSMTSSQTRCIEMAFSEIKEIFRTYTADKVHLIQCDDYVRDVQIYNSQNLPESIAIKGGNGTRFTPVFQYIEDHKLNPESLIYFSDMYCYDIPEKKPNYQVMWAKTVLDDFHHKPKFGEIVKLVKEKEE